MGKFGVFSTPEDRARELMLGEKKTAVETSLILREEGYNFTPNQLGNIKKTAFEDLVSDQKQEVMADFLLDSVKKTTFKFEEIFEKFENMYAQFEKEGKPFEQMAALREMKSMLNMSLKKLGEYKAGIERIQTQNVNIITSNDVMVAIQGNQERWFTAMEPEVEDGKLIFNKPTSEVLDAYYKWQFRNNRTKVI